ncbi:hypothetical protein DL764_004714 [Monosporascus ibericus]|uniref:Uncharacterized protein n=1 Tax=Monosporascus ibericus TaxID=155417 RepID=A0A4Q4TEU1_9PEZI|nr:hypothetical protein DL764_004714 [Monosporascus ibericus]
MHKRKADQAFGVEDDVGVRLRKASPKDIPEAILNEMHHAPRSGRLTISVDFGTKFSAISYVTINPDEAAENIGLDRIRSIDNWPDDRNMDRGSHMKQQVLSEVMYPLDPKFRDAADLQTRDRDGSPFDIGGLPDTIPDSDEDADVTLFGTDVDSFWWGYSVHEAWSKPSTHFKPANKALGRFELLFDDRPTTETVRRELASTLTSLKVRKVSELRRQGLYNGYQVEMVLCVPAIWSQKACRDMQVAQTAAMRMADFKGLDLETDATEDFFIVSEPEAAAASSRTIRGGTVDTNTYTVSRTTPLRLTKEIVQLSGDLCGSSYLNEAFRGLLREKLEEERYLERGQVVLDGIVENNLISEFEYKTKRHYDIYDRQRLPESFYCGGVQDNREKGFLGGCVYIRFGEMRAIFHKRLQRIVALMEQQIMGAASEDKVVVIGGFAGSPSLQKELARRLKELSTKFALDIELIVRGNRGRRSRLYGYVSLSCAVTNFQSMEVPPDSYVKRYCAQRVGRIVVDFTFLRDQGLIQPIYNRIPEGRNKGMRVGKPHYQVDYTMVIEVVDRDLRCHAIYGGEIVKKCKINVARRFLPWGQIAAYKQRRIIVSFSDDQLMFPDQLGGVTHALRKGSLDLETPAKTELS